MTDPAIIVLIAACLLVGALVGVVALLSFVGVLLHKAAGASSIYAPAVPKRPVGFASDRELQTAPASSQDAFPAAAGADFYAAVRESDAREALDALQEPSGRPTGDFRAEPRVPGCGLCKRLRKAFLGKK